MGKHRNTVRTASTAVVTAGLMALGATHPAHAKPKNGWYFDGKGGPSYSALSSVKSATAGETTYESSGSNIIGAFGMAGGYEWMYKYHIPLRTELEFMNRTEVTYDAAPLTTANGSGSLASTAQNITTMANAYWHFPVGSKIWWPYVSGGLGWAHTKTKSTYNASGSNTGTDYSNTNDNLAWSVGAGVSLKMGPDMTNDIELRHVDLGSVDWGLPTQNIKTDNFSATELVFAIRYNF